MAYSVKEKPGEIISNVIRMSTNINNATSPAMKLFCFNF